MQQLTLPHATDRLPDWQEAWRRTGALVLLLDFDGTLAPIVSRPEDAALPTRTANALQRLHQIESLTMAVVSGRAMADARERVALPDIAYAGNHGMEIEGPGLNRIHEDAARARPALVSVADRLRGQVGRSPSGANRLLVTHQPVGISVLITPWNFPAAMATRKLAPALAAGNAVVMKPPKQTPLTALRIGELVLAPEESEQTCLRFEFSEHELWLNVTQSQWELRSGEDRWESALKLTPETQVLANTQEHWSMEGRAIVREPQVFCMDEPLSNLDAKLRVQARTRSPCCSASMISRASALIACRLFSVASNRSSRFKARSRASCGLRHATSRSPGWRASASRTSPPTASSTPRCASLRSSTSRPA